MKIRKRYINDQHILANDAETLSIQSIKQHRQTVAPIIINTIFRLYDERIFAGRTRTVNIQSYFRRSYIVCAERKRFC